MIKRFIEVIPHKLYRGSAPSPKDVAQLKDKLNINKIISLDALSGKKIERVCKLLNIKHIMLPINGTKRSLINFLSHNLKKLLLDDGPTFIHCFEGKDRTGLAIALFKCKYMGMDPEKAIEEAKSLGFGVGVDPTLINLYEKLIKGCKPVNDNNDADIVSNVREYKSDNRDSFLEESERGSFSPYLSTTRQYPYDAVYNYINDQNPTRETGINKEIDEVPRENAIPQVGVYNNEVGRSGFGPVISPGGFIYE